MVSPIRPRSVVASFGLLVTQLTASFAALGRQRRDDVDCGGMRDAMEREFIAREARR